MRLEREQAVIASAGHPAPLVVRDDGRVREIGTVGPILGAWTGELPVERAVPVAADETLFLYTDGVIDTLGEHERFGAERLKRLLAEHAGETPDELLSDRSRRDSTDSRSAPRRMTPRRWRCARRRWPAGAGAQGDASGGRFSYASGHLTEGGAVGSRPNFRIETLESQSGITIKLAGELDSATSTQLLARFEQAVAALDGRELVIDLDEVSFIDSSGMRAIIVIERRAEEERIALAIAPPPAAVTELLHVTGIADRLPLDAATRKTRRRPGRSSSESRSRSPAMPMRRRGHAPSCARRSPGACRTRQRHRDAADLRARDQRRDPSRAERSAASVGLRITTYGDRIRVEVTDDGAGLRPGGPAAAKPSETGGHGLVVVDGLSSRWGTARRGSAEARASASGSSSTPMPSGSMLGLSRRCRR